MICFAPSSAIYAAPNGSRADAAVAQKCRSKWSAHYPSQTVRPPQRDDRFGSADLAFGCYSGPKTISLGRLALLARLGFPSQGGTNGSNPPPSSEESCKPSVPRGRLSQSGTRVRPHRPILWLWCSKPCARPTLRVSCRQRALSARPRYHHSLPGSPCPY